MGTEQHIVKRPGKLLIIFAVMKEFSHSNFLSEQQISKQQKVVLTPKHLLLTPTFVY